MIEDISKLVLFLWVIWSYSCGGYMIGWFLMGFITKLKRKKLQEVFGPIEVGTYWAQNNSRNCYSVVTESTPWKITYNTLYRTITDPTQLHWIGRKNTLSPEAFLEEHVQVTLDVSQIRGDLQWWKEFQ